MYRGKRSWHKLAVFSIHFCAEAWVVFKLGRPLRLQKRLLKAQVQSAHAAMKASMQMLTRTASNRHSKSACMCLHTLNQFRMAPHRGVWI